MTQEIILFIITTVITAVLGVIGYFLKRTMDRNDKNEAAVQELRDNLLTLSDKYATKAEIREIKASMEKLSENIDYIKEHTTKNEDFIRTMARLESKIDHYCSRKEAERWNRQKCCGGCSKKHFSRITAWC